MKEEPSLLEKGAEDCDEVAARQSGTVRREADAVKSPIPHHPITYKSPASLKLK
jgi:hypothetical protein